MKPYPSKKSSMKSPLPRAALLALAALAALPACSRERAPVTSRAFTPDAPPGAAARGKSDSSSTDSQLTAPSALVDAEPTPGPDPRTTAANRDKRPPITACARLDALMNDKPSSGEHFAYLNQLEIDRAEGGPRYAGKIDLANSPFTQALLVARAQALSPEASASEDVDTTRAEWRASFPGIFGDTDALTPRSLHFELLVRAGAFSPNSLAPIPPAGQPSATPSASSGVPVSAIRTEAKVGPAAQSSAGHGSKRTSSIRPTPMGSPLPLAVAPSPSPSPSHFPAPAAAELTDAELIRRLTSSLPLWSGGAEGSHASDARESLKAAINTAKSKSNTTAERVCGFILWERTLAQMLSVQGYASLPLHDGHLAEMTGPEAMPSPTDVPGAFGDEKSGKAVCLGVDDLRAYDPAQRPLVALSAPSTSLRATTLTSQLDWLETSTYWLEASFPGSPWFTRENYPFGDLAQASGPAILPAEMPALALGLVSLGLKNLQSFNLQKITAKGVLAGPGDRASGIVLGTPADWSAQATDFSLADVARLTRSVVYLERVLDQLAADAAAGKAWYLHDAHSLYADAKTRESLIGPDLPAPVASASPAPSRPGADARNAGDTAAETASSASAVSSTPAAAPTSVRASLAKLHAPLAALLVKMARAKTGCMSGLHWNLSDGSHHAIGACSEEDQKVARAAIRLLGLQAKAPILLKD